MTGTRGRPRKTGDPGIVDELRALRRRRETLLEDQAAERERLWQESAQVARRLRESGASLSVIAEAYGTTALTTARALAGAETTPSTTPVPPEPTTVVREDLGDGVTRLKVTNWRGYTGHLDLGPDDLPVFPVNDAGSVLHKAVMAGEVVE